MTARLVWLYSEFVNMCRLNTGDPRARTPQRWADVDPRNTAHVSERAA